MSRPKPTILLQHVDKNTYRSEQILESEAIWAVFYKDKPFNLRSEHTLNADSATKYKKTCFNSPGHAHSLAKKLNKMFKCQDFSVYLLKNGEKI